VSARRRRRAILEAGKATYKSPNRGLALLDEAIEQIELQAKAVDKGQWHQANYRCNSGMCVAGWVAQLAGGEWAAPASDSMNNDMLKAIPEDNPEEVDSGMIHAHDRALILLAPDLTEDDCDVLFAGYNDLGDIREYRNQIARGEHY
jgi:hypothetical protein